MGVLPIALSHLMLRFGIRRLPHQFFVYVLFNGHFCGALTMAMAVAVSSLLMSCCSAYTAQQLLRRHLPFAPFMVFAEAFFTGMLTAGLVLLRPQRISSFCDRINQNGK